MKALSLLLLIFSGPGLPAAYAEDDVRLPVPAWTHGIARCRTSLGFELGELRSDRMAELAPRECVSADGRRLFLSNGYSIDLSTCAADRTALDRAIRFTRAMYSVLGCVRGHNREMEAAGLAFISDRRPRLRCLGHLSEEDASRACSEEELSQGCRDRVRARVGGFARPGSSDLTMVAGDPTVSDAAATAKAFQITHELMHAAGVPSHDPFHERADRERYLERLTPELRTEAMRTRLSNWKAADPVYGIDLLCGGSVPGTPTDNREALTRLRAERGPLPLLDGGTFDPPGNVFEMGCSALKSYRRGMECYSFLPDWRCPPRATAQEEARLNLELLEINPACRALGRAIEALR